jgi:mannose-6-phosphate isomerase-like protein (cupin superfamily)
VHRQPSRPHETQWEKQHLSALNAYKRAPDLSNSTWYKGVLNSLMAGKKDNDGAFDFCIIRMKRGTEPPPHVHSREHEFFYILSGEVRLFVDDEVFELTTGDCIYLPLGRPHAFRIISDELHWIAFITPGGFFEAVSEMNAPAERMEVPADANVITYANADMTETIKVFERYGLQFLTADEIRRQMPEYPL